MRRNLAATDLCPCGRRAYGDCCGPLLDGIEAVTAEDLMRSRYTAYVLGDADHVFRTWHPRTRRDGAGEEPTQYTGLLIVDIVDGGADDAEGVVEFEARFVDNCGGYGHGGAHAHVLHERSRFVRRAGRWRYLDGRAEVR